MEEKKAKELASSSWEPSGGGTFSSYLEGSVSRLNRAFVRDFEEALAVYRDLFLEGNGKDNHTDTASPASAALMVRVVWTLLRRRGWREADAGLLGAARHHRHAL